MDEELDIIVTGFDVDARLAEAGLVRVFGIDARRAQRFVHELPIVAKRCGSAAVAERYVNALRSIGARIEVQKVASPEGSGPASARARHSSLPIPAPSMLANQQESTRIARETERAVRRFRLAEGLDPVRSETDALDVDPENPTFPKAPRVPHDLARMPNAALPRFSDRPDWILTDPLSQPPDAGDSGEPAHADARLPPARSSRPPPRGSDPPQRDADMERDERGPGSIRPSAIGLAHAATASVRPGLGLFSWWSWQTPPEVRRRLRRFWPVVLALVLLLYAGLRLSGAFDSPQDRRERRWRRYGIDPGENAAAERWLEPGNHAVDGLDRTAARELVQRLSRAGARGVYAVRIRRTAEGETADGLVIELPDDPGGRRTISWHAARALGQKRLLADHGEPYFELTFR